ncbi:MAG: lysophospholipid acyltransferase family protein [Halioglobus sp.]|nr:lysophospholipid acyltransferase family protein [Halioglobus sp.]
MFLLEKNNSPLSDPQMLERHIKLALAVKAPNGLTIEIAYQIVKRVFNPMVSGAQNIPKGPCLFVGNHSLFALDGAIIRPIFLKELQRFPRAMGDKFLFTIQRVANILVDQGIVMGHPDVCRALMDAQQDLLLFPGGAYESVKPKSKLYELQWKERYGFVTLAAMHGYTIMPFGLVGPDDFYGHLMEGQDLPNSPLGKLLSHVGLLNADTRSDIIPPIPIGSLGTPLPKPQRCYLGFGQPINLSQYKSKKLAKGKVRSIREQVAEQIEIQLAELLLKREKDKGNDSLLKRLLTF